MLQINNLEFGYTSTGASFSDAIKRGELVFVLGANGSGKTTLLKTLAHLRNPPSGSVLLESSQQTPPPLHKDIHNSSLRPLYLSAHPEISEWLTGHDVFEIFSNGPSQWKHEEDIIDLEISEIINKPLHQLSLGEQKRIFLAAALQSSSPLLLLDEPLNSLDWNMEFRIQKILQRHLQAKRSFIVSAHQLQWVARWPTARAWFLHKLARLKSGQVKAVLTSTEVQSVFNFNVAFTDNPIDGSPLLAISDTKRTT